MEEQHKGKLHFIYAKDYNTAKSLHDVEEAITFSSFLEKASLSEAFVLVMLELECVWNLLLYKGRKRQ